jgi:hypothetical protein
MKGDIRQIASIISVSVFFSMAAGVARASSGAPAPALTGIEVKSIESGKLLAGQARRFTATGTYSDGSTVDISSQVTWSLSNTSVATISSSGLVSPAATGDGGPGRGSGSRSGGGLGMGGGSRQDGGPRQLSGPGRMGTDREGRGPGRGDGRSMSSPGTGGGRRGGGRPGQGGGSSDVVVLVTASLSGVTSSPASLTISTTEGPAAYAQSAGTISKSKETFTAPNANESGIKVTDKGVFTLSDSTIATSGDTTGMETSSFYGLNAGVLAASGGKITLANSAITTRGRGANGVFAMGAGSTVDLSKVKIDCVASGAHGVDATFGGTIVCTDVNITTAGNGAAAAISTDRGGGTVTFVRGSAFSSGTRSPGIYSTGDISVADATIRATGSEAVVIEGKNTVTLTRTALSCLRQCGAMLYQSFSGDAQVGSCRFAMNGGSLAAAEGPLFYVTNTRAVIELKDAELSAASGTFVNAAAGNWGREGSNGGEVTLTLDGERLAGNITCDKISSITGTFQNNTVFKGAVNSDRTAKMIALNLDATSVWDVTGDSHVTTLTDADTTLANLHDNGHTIHYDAGAAGNRWLDGKTRSLAGGGKLTPEP